MEGCWEVARKGILYGINLWISCLVFLLPLKRRKHFIIRLLLTGIGTILSLGYLYFFSEWIVKTVWSQILLLFFGYFGAVFVFLICTEVRKFEMWYCGVLGYMVCLLLFNAGNMARIFINQMSGSAAGYAIEVLVIIIGYTVIGLTAARWMPEKNHYQIGPRQMLSAWVLCVMSCTQCIFIYLEKESLPIIVLLQFYCTTLLYLQNVLFKKSSMRKDLDTIQALWYQQKSQYQITKETIDLINHKCHNLKHQVQAMRMIKNDEERELYLKEIEEAVQIYGAVVRTGNEILDVILTEKSLICENNGIHINCVADGSLLSFMDPVDLYIFLGNALDNAIEAVRKIESRKKRFIDFMLYEKQNLLMIQLVNPIQSQVQFDDGLPLTTKARNGYHGYGMKSIRHIIEKYDGYLNAEVKDGCFFLKIMMPLQIEK